MICVFLGVFFYRLIRYKRSLVAVFFPAAAFCPPSSSSFVVVENRFRRFSILLTQKKRNILIKRVLCLTEGCGGGGCGFGELVVVFVVVGCHQFSFLIFFLSALNLVWRVLRERERESDDDADDDAERRRRGKQKIKTC